MINHIAYTSKSMIAKAIADRKHISYLLVQITSNYSDMHCGRIYQDKIPTAILLTLYDQLHHGLPGLHIESIILAGLAAV